jgi:hypothetical protein
MHYSAQIKHAYSLEAYIGFLLKWCSAVSMGLLEVGLGPFVLFSLDAVVPFSFKKQTWAGHQWLTPIILATQEAEIRRITVQSQPGQIVLKTLSQKNLYKKKGLAEWVKV